MQPETMKLSPKVAAAIVAVMTKVKKLAKADENKFDRYNFTSIDAFMEALNPLCAEAELFILCDEESTEVVPGEVKDGKQRASQLHVTWVFNLVHSSGEMAGPYRRSVAVPANGAQAYGSAQSYALKQFMRGLFMVPTGDKDDADHQQAEPLRGRGQTAKPTPPPAPPMPKLDPAKPEAVEFKGKTQAAARQWAMAFGPVIKKSPDKESLGKWFSLNEGPLEDVKQLDPASHQRLCEIHDTLEFPETEAANEDAEKAEAA